MDFGFQSSQLQFEVLLIEQGQVKAIPRAMASPLHRNRERGDHIEKRAKRRVIRLLQDAVAKNDISEIRKLLTEDVDVNFQYRSQTLLQVAVLSGHLESCKLLISHGADVNHHNADGNTLLNMVCWKGYDNIAKLLINNNADVDTANNDGATPINTCAFKGFAGIAKLLVKANCNLLRLNNRSQSPLFTAARMGHIPVTDVLIRGGCDLNQADNEKKTPLIIAASKGYSEVVKMLIKAGCETNLLDKYKCSALHEAAVAGHVKVVEELILGGANLDVLTAKKETPLLFAVRNNQYAVSDALVQAGCDVDLADVYKQAPIHAAVRQATQYFGTDGATVELLLDAGCNINAQDGQGWTPLYQSALAGDVDLCFKLLQRKADVNLVTDLGDSVMHAAVSGNSCELVKTFIQAGCSVNVTNNRNMLPLYTAISHRADIKIIEALLAAGSSLNIQESEHRESPLFAAARLDYKEAFQALLDAGADVNLVNNEGTTALGEAVDRGNARIAVQLLHHPGCDKDAGYVFTPLHNAVKRGYEKMTTTLLEAGCNIDNVNGSGITPVQVAVEEGNFRILRLLLWWGCNLRACENISYVIMKCCIQHRDRHPHAELQPIFVICKFQDVRLMKLLLQCYHQLPYNLIHAVHDVLTIGFGPNSMFNQRVNEEMVQILRDAMTEARPLKDLCRGAIRKALGVRPFSKIDDLPVPNSMKNYILMTEELGKDLPQDDEIIERDDMFESYEVPPTEE